MYALLIGLARAAEPRWTVVQTPHVDVYTDTSSATARAAAEQLEGLDALLVSLFPEVAARHPVRSLPVLLFRDPIEFGALIGDPDAAAWFDDDPDRPLAAAVATRWEQAAPAVFHAYVDRWFDLRPRPAPWLATGLAEYLAQTRIEGGTATEGRVDDRHLAVLRDRDWIPIDDVLAATAASTLPTARRTRERFESEAWLLVHWCMADPERRARLFTWTAADRRPTPTDPFDLSADAPLADALVDHLATLGPDTSIARADVSRERMTAAGDARVVDIEYRLGMILASGGRSEEALARFQAARSRDPSSWLPYDGIGRVELGRRRWAAARIAFAAAIERNPTTPAPYLGLGAAALSGFGRRAVSEPAAAGLELALTLDPTRIDAYVSLASIAGGRRDWVTSTRWAGRGLQLDPRDARLRALLARAQLAQGDREHAVLNARIAMQECAVTGSCDLARAVFQSAAQR